MNTLERYKEVLEKKEYDNYRLFKRTLQTENLEELIKVIDDSIPYSEHHDNLTDIILANAEDCIFMFEETLDTIYFECAKNLILDLAQEYIDKGRI